MVPDTMAPAVTATSPANGATNVGAAANVTATFSEEMRRGTVNAVNITLHEEGTPATDLVDAIVTYDPANKRAIINPNDPLVRGATYTATVTTRVKDLDGIALDQNPTQAGNQPKVWRFTIRI